MDHSPHERRPFSDEHLPDVPPDHQPSDSPLSTSADQVPPPSLLTPFSKEECVRERMISNPHRDDRLSILPAEEEGDQEESFYQEPPPPGAFSQWGLPILLFGLTVFTTLWAGAFQVNTKPVHGAWDFLIRHPGSLVHGIPFAATLLGILVIHESGHYVLSRIHRVPASFPLFIPGPPHFIGTFGAVIRMRSAIMNRRALFDIGVAGPIAGFVAAVVAIIVGLSLSHVVPRSQAYGLQLGEPLLLQFFAWMMFGPIPPTHDIVLHPIAFAAWFGFFVTAINLLPLGQLDGGHVAFAVFGRRQRSLALATLPVLIYLGLTGWPGWIIWVALAGLVGIAHPPVIDPHTVLGGRRRWVAWAALAIFIVTFAPVPFSVG
jgi:membrane-associated protease RseP (regulator of RpoE activity)